MFHSIMSSKGSYNSQPNITIPARQGLKSVKALIPPVFLMLALVRRGSGQAVSVYIFFFFFAKIKFSISVKFKCSGFDMAVSPALQHLRGL